MSNAFIVYVRNEEQVLLLKRADSVSEFPLAWDGVFGVGDTILVPRYCLFLFRI